MSQFCNEEIIIIKVLFIISRKG